MDYATNWVTNTFDVTITNNGLAKTLTYDLNGNLTEYSTPTLTNKYDWDAADRLVKISRRPAGGQWNVTQFTYDGLGRRLRISETTNNSTSIKSFLWCETELCEERNSSGGTVNRRFFGQGEQISGTDYVFTRDHLGSVREMISGGGTIQARYEFDPYGRRTKVSGSSDPESDFAYTGHYYHQKSGLHLARYRAYDTDTARWISRDPIEEDGGLNIYRYVESDPVNTIDALGLVPNSLPPDPRIPGGPWFWRDDPRNSRGGKWHGRNGAIASWEAAGEHWDVDGGRGQRAKYNRWGAAITDWQSHHPPKRHIKTGHLFFRSASKVVTTLGVGGFAFRGLGAEASAQRMVDTAKGIVQDCRDGKDDWAYVGLLTIRHEVNQQTGFMGDAVMRQMTRQMEK